MLTLTVIFALLCGSSAAFASWLCCVALADCFLTIFARDAEAGELPGLESAHERTA